MNGVVGGIAAEAEGPSHIGLVSSPQTTPRDSGEVNSAGRPAIDGLRAHQFPSRSQPEQLGSEAGSTVSEAAQRLAEILREYEEIESEEENRRRRIYRGRTVAMLRRYLKYSMETGRLPSLLGQEFFRAKVTAYRVVTFEDRVIFVHDMEKCLERLDEFSRQLIARHVLQEHDRCATARLLHCNEKTVRRLTPVALDQLCEIMLEVGLMERIDLIAEKSCQGGLGDENLASDCEESENKF